MMNPENIVVLTLTFAQGGGERKQEECSIDWKSGLYALSSNCKLLVSQLKMNRTCVPEVHGAAVCMRPEASKVHVV